MSMSVGLMPLSIANIVFASLISSVISPLAFMCNVSKSYKLGFANVVIDLLMIVVDDKLL